MSRRSVPAALVAAAIGLGALAGCGSEPAEVTVAEYLAALDAICTDTAEALAALPTPPEEISATDFATSAASALDDEASRMRGLDVPDEVADDHRALVRNTEEQAAAWSEIAGRTDAGDEEIADTTTLIAQLQLGRADLVTEMGATGCRRVAG